MYLICSLVFFASRPLIQTLTGESLRGVATVTFGGDTRPPTPAELEELRTGLPARIFGADRVERAVTDIGRLNREIYSAFSRAMFALLPVFALLTNVAWRRTRPRYPVHLYAALHIHAAIFGALTISRAATLIPSPAFRSVVAVLVGVYVMWYGFTALRRIFGDSWPRTILKALAIGIAYMICLNVVALALVGYVISRA